ncbi:MAG TPA: TIGR03915 family putative DNA repair protein [Arachidicoccus sp.]
MPDTKIYAFDGSFYGLLCAIFQSYERKHKHIKLIEKNGSANFLFDDVIDVATNQQQADRVLKALQKKIYPNHFKFFCDAFFAQNEDVYHHLLQYAVYIFDNEKGVDNNYGNEHVLALSQFSQKVHREAHRMKAFIRFQQADDGLFFAVVKPDFNVLPLIAKHFMKRYNNQRWVIYDKQRKYGLYYNLTTIEEVTFTFSHNENSLAKSENVMIDKNELLYNILWKDYFKSTNIVERKNMKLHLQHIPKRYWRYLAEKQI